MSAVAQLLRKESGDGQAALGGPGLHGVGGSGDIPGGKSAKIASILRRAPDAVLKNGAVCFGGLERMPGRSTESGLKGWLQAVCWS